MDDPVAMGPIERVADLDGDPERSIELRFFRCTLRSEPRPAMGQEMRWVPLAELASIQLPPA